jgi:hypothetical protein
MANPSDRSNQPPLHVCDSKKPWEHETAVTATPLVNEYIDLINRGVQPTDVKRQLGFLGTNAETLKEADGSTLRVRFASPGSDEIANIEKHGADGKLLQLDKYGSGENQDAIITKKIGGPGQSFENALIISKNNFTKTWVDTKDSKGFPVTTVDTFFSHPFVNTSHRTISIASCKPGEKEKDYWRSHEPGD